MRWSDDVLSEVRGHVGFITLNRPKALNALSLPMVRELTAVLRAWANDARVFAVAIRGSDKQGPFGAFCAGGDIRFFHQAALSGDAQLEDFFTEEYALNHLIHRYPKPYIAFMDGVVMGGGMGLSQGARLRIVTERTQMAMPETLIGLFPDVAGGYFLSRCPGHLGEHLALMGQTLHGPEALCAGLADACMPSAQQAALWQSLGERDGRDAAGLMAHLHSELAASTAEMRPAALPWWSDALDAVMALPDATNIAQELARRSAQAGAPDDDAFTRVLTALRQRSPLMLHVTLTQIRRARGMGLADALRMERNMVRHCFHTEHLQRRAAATDTVEGIRALAVDKDRQPRWNPTRLEDVTPEMVGPFFVSPWPSAAHPLRDLRD